MKPSILLKSSSVLWMIWGIFHLMIGVVMIYLLSLGNEALSLNFVASDPLTADMVREYSPIVTASLKQHSWNLGWFGMVWWRLLVAWEFGEKALQPFLLPLWSPV